MKTNLKNLIQNNYFLQPGYIIFPSLPTIISSVVASCVAVCIFDKEKKIGAMNHFQFPYTKDKTAATARYGNIAMITLLNIMINNGSKIKHMKAQIFGGAHNPEYGQKNIGQKNIEVAKKVLKKKNVKIISEDVNGEIGRKIVFNTQLNEILVVKVENLRKSDWYPYHNKR